MAKPKQKYEIRLKYTSTDGGKTFYGGASFHESYGDGNGSTQGVSGKCKSLEDMIRCLKNITPKKFKT